LIHFYKSFRREFYQPSIMEGCCSWRVIVVKFFMVLSNIFCAIAGIALIATGAYTQIAAKDYLNFVGYNYVNTPIFMMILGCGILVITGFGCLGACKESKCLGACMESKCLIYTYGVILVIIVIAQLGAGIAAYVAEGDIDQAIKENMEKGMHNYGTESHEGVTHTWDLVQGTYKCCGVNSASDWAREQGETFGTGEAPDSCCKAGNSEGCGKVPNVEFFPEGCYEKFKEDFTGNIGIVGGVAVGIALCELVTAGIAFWLGKRMGQGQYV